MDTPILPVDISHPAVQEYLSLIRLQVLTPLSLLINVATILICTTISKPTIGRVATLHPTSISPNHALIAIYVAAIWIGQIGYCFLIVVARKPETKKTIVKGVGLSLVFANWLMAIWAIAWVLQWFIFAAIVQGLLLVCLLYSVIALIIYHPPTTSRPLDMGLIHAPLRLFFILPFSVLFPYTLFVSLDLAYSRNFDYADHSWPGFAVVFSTNILSILLVSIRRDIVWCVAATWICVSIWAQQPKPASVHFTEILFTVLHPIALFASYVYMWLYRDGQIVLPPDREEQRQSGYQRRDQREESRDVQRPREVNDDEVWG